MPEVTKGSEAESCFYLEFEEKPGTYLFTRPARLDEETMSGKVCYLVEEPKDSNNFIGNCQCKGFSVRKTCRHIDLIAKAYRPGDTTDNYAETKKNVVESRAKADDLINSLFDEEETPESIESPEAPNS